MRDDQAFVPGLTQQNAVMLLEAAAKHGYNEYDIATQEDGFLVPAPLVDKIWPPRRRKE